MEKKRDDRSAEADRLVVRHHKYATAVALFQIAIALGAIAALAKVRLAWAASLVLGAAGVATMPLPYLRPE